MTGMPDFTQLKRLAFRGETSGRIKELRGFTKGNSVPEGDSPFARKYIARIAAEDIQADIDQTYQSIRESFDFKRKQIETSVDEGCGVIRTPRFYYMVTVTGDASTQGGISWRREIASFDDPSLVRTPEFQNVFGKLFSSLCFEFEEPINIADIVDQFEDEDLPGVKVACASDASWCEIKLQGFVGAIRMEPKESTISGGASSSLASLLDQFLAFLDRLPREPEVAAIS